MEQRIDMKAAPKQYQAMEALERSFADSAIERPLRELVKLRCSQVNGCAFCVDMHWKDARASGEGEQRLYGLSAWHEAPYYSERERAALAWAEAVTRLEDGHVPDALYAETRKVFDETQLAELTWVIAAINVWNRMCIAFRTRAGEYKPRHDPSVRPPV
jgi:AhpD family alkylhydroperoxidase